MNELLAAHGGELVVDEARPLPGPHADDMVVKYVCNTKLDIIQEQITLSLARPDMPRFFGSTVLEKDGAWHVKWAKHPIAIVAGGPTLRKTIRDVKNFKTVMCAGSSHDYCISHGIVPDYCVLIDAIPEAVDWLKYPQHTTTYLVASQNHSAMFDHLRDFKVHMWHAMGADHAFDHEPSIGGGSTAAMRCIEIAFLMGFWDMHFFGMDSCYLDDGTTHAYDDWLPPQPCNVTVHTDDAPPRLFKSDLGMIGQAEVFIETFRQRKDFMRATIHGDNLIAETVRSDHGHGGIHLA
jgi:hypothetical protein